MRLAGSISLDDWSARLDRGLTEQHLELPGSVREALLAFARLLARWNRVHNLISAADTERLIERHVLDSLAVQSWLPPVDGSSLSSWAVIDLGSGAGLPVMPLALVRRDLRFLSIESNGKKARFQRQVIIELEIGNVEVCDRRIEATTATAPCVVARALAPLDRLLPLAAPLCQHDGRLLIMLGHAARFPRTLPAGWRLDTVERLPDRGATRHVAVVVRQTN